MKNNCVCCGKKFKENEQSYILFNTEDLYCEKCLDNILNNIESIHHYKNEYREN